MYDKTLTSVNTDLREFVIALENSCLDEFLHYRDEGNMNIVVSLFSQEEGDKYVIRFKKISTDAAEQNFNDHKHELMSFIHFEDLLQKYFDHFTVVPKIAFVDVDISALNEFLMRDRPAVRRTKIIGHNYGLLYRDVAFLPKEIYVGKQVTLSGVEFKDSPTICIEIKVKQGYVMTDSDHGAQKCRYCYFQYLKLKMGKISQVSSYCPIDLFSGNADRMNRAIKGLFENPQNNLKMFQNGKMVYNEYSSDKHSLKLIMKSLFPDVKSVEKQEILLINLVRKILLKDFICCDNTVDLCLDYKHCIENVHLRSCVSDMFSQLPRNCILNSILKAQNLVGDNLTNMEFFEKEGREIDGYERILQDYRMGSTALDCSVMITLRKINIDYENDIEKIVNPNHYLKVLSGPGRCAAAQYYAVNATVVDLDEKKDALAHYRKYKKQYNESKFAYYEFMQKNQNAA